MSNEGKACMVQGRLVWTSGDLFKGRIKTEFGTQTPKRNAKGETLMEYGFGLAVSKTLLNQCAPGQPGEVWAVMHEQAYTLYPNRQIPPGFAMKYKDGDGIDDKGVPFSQREGYAGHIVLACTTTIPIKFFKYENGQNILINEGIKCGDYCNVQLNIKAHGAIGAGKAGLYLNPNAVQFLGFGKEIINAPSGDQIFGLSAPPMPAGASPTPIAPAGMIMPTGAMPQAPAPQGYAPPAAQPHFGVVPTQFQPPPGGQPVSPTAPMPAMPGVPTYPGQQ